MITLGKFTILDMDADNVWIMITGDGEGGQFKKSDLAEIIKKFYAENF